MPTSLTYGNVKYTNVTSGNPTKVASFNGLAGSISIPSLSSSTTNTILIAGATFTAWVNYYGITNGCPVIVQIYNTTTGTFRLGLNGGCSSTTPYIYTEHPMWPSEWSASAYPFNTNQWYFLSGTWNSVNSRISLYVNGQLYATGITWNAIGGFKSPAASIGGAYGTFNGMIADAQIYNSVLTASQIAQLYQQGLPLYGKMNVSLG